MPTEPRKKGRAVTEEEKQDRANRIKYLRKLLHCTGLAFAELCEMSESSIKSWEQARYTGLTIEGALKIVEACQKQGLNNCTLEWLYYGKGAGPGIKTNFASNPPLQAIMQELQLFQQVHPNSMDAIIQDHEMEPYLCPGDHVAGIRYFANEFKLLIGLPCIVELATGEIMVRYLKAGEKAGCYHLTGTHPTRGNLKNVKLFSAAYIIWIRKPELVR